MVPTGVLGAPERLEEGIWTGVTKGYIGELQPAGVLVRTDMVSLANKASLSN